MSSRVILAAVTAKTNSTRFLAKKLSLVALATLTGVLSGCGPRIPPDAMKVPTDLQPRGVDASLTNSLADNASRLSDDKIFRLVDEKLTLPDDAEVAVFTIGQTLRRVRADGSATPDGDALEVAFFQSLTESEHVSRARKLPRMLHPESPTLQALREAAALNRADVLLVLQTLTRTRQVLNTGRVDAVTEVEAVLIDVRSGSVPFSTQVAETFDLKANTNSLAGREELAEANRQAVGRAWTRVAEETAAFLATLEEPKADEAMEEVGDVINDINDAAAPVGDVEFDR